jgi:hypothetical protein
MRILFPFCLAVLSTASLAVAAVPATVNIGGLFSIFDEDGNPDHDAMQLQAAFVLAIGAINNKADGFYDDILPNTQIKFAIRGDRGIYKNVVGANDLLSSVSIDGEVGVHALVNGLIANDENAGVVSVLTELIVDHPASLIQGTPDKSFPGSSSAILHSIPAVVDKARALQDIICNHFKFRKLSIFFSPNTFGVESLERFKNGDFCNFEIAFELAIEQKSVEGQVLLIPEKNYVNRVFVLLMDDAVAAGNYLFLFIYLFYFIFNQYFLFKLTYAQTLKINYNAGHLLEKGYETGLFRLGTQIFLADAVMDVVGLTSGMSPGANVARILAGTIGLQFWPSYYFYVSNPRNDYLFYLWGLTPPTIGSSAGVCNNRTDDSGKRYLYQNDNGSVCAGLDYASFTSLEEITPLFAFVWDAVVMAAAGLHKLLITDGLPLTSTAAVYHETVIGATIDRAPMDGNLIFILFIFIELFLPV